MNRVSRVTIWLVVACALFLLALIDPFDLFDPFLQRLAALSSVLALGAAFWPLLPIRTRTAITKLFTSNQNPSSRSRTARPVANAIRGKRVRRYAVVGICLIGIVASGIWIWPTFQNALKPCEWIDLRLRKSGCIGNFGTVPNNTLMYFISNEIFAAEGLNNIARWNFSKGSYLPTVQTPSVLLAFTDIPNTNKLATFEANNIVRIWNGDSGELQQTIPLQKSTSFLDHTTLTMTANDGVLVIGSMFDRSTIVLKSYNFTRTIEISQTTIYAVSANADLFAYSPGSGGITILHTTDGSKVRSIDVRQLDVEKIGFSADGKVLIAVLQGGIINRWHIPTGKLLSSTSVLRPDYSDVSISKDGTRAAIISMDEHTVQLWNLETSKMVSSRTLPEPIKSMAMSPDGRTIAIGFTAYTEYGQPYANKYRIQLWHLT